MDNVPDQRDHGKWHIPVRYTLTLLACLLLVLLAILLKRVRTRRRFTAHAIAIPLKPAEQLLEQDDGAFKLPADEWTRMAMEFMNQGDYRKAMRAMFFASLVHLAHTGAISINRCKSNRDYLRELARKAHDQKPVVDAFDQNTRLLERVWYGSHTATAEMAASFFKNKDMITGEC